MENSEKENGTHVASPRALSRYHLSMRIQHITQINW